MPAISASKPATMVKIDRERRIRFTWSSTCRFEEQFGMTLVEALTTSVGARFFTYLAWAGMLHDKPKLTISETEHRIDKFVDDGGDINALAKDLMDALTDSGVLGQKAETEEEADEDPEGEAAAVEE